VRRLPATTASYGIEFFADIGFHAATTVMAVYFVQEVGLNPLELVLLGTAFEATIFLFEIPTGVIADTYSRRASVILGLALEGVAAIATGLTESYPLLVAAAILWGIAATCMSGAYEAWITDEVGVERVGRVFFRNAQFAYAGAIAGALLGVGIATVDLGTAVAAGGAITLATALVCVLVMPEHGFVRKPASERLGAWRDVRTTAIAGGRLIRAERLLLVIMAITFFIGAASEGVDRLWEAHLIRDVGLPGLGRLDPVVWFGLINAAGLLAGIVITSLLIPRFEHAANAAIARTLMLLTAVVSVSVIVFGLATGFALALGAYMVARLARRITEPLYLTWLNRNIEDSSVRATVMSMVNQTGAVGEIAGGPGVGAVGTVISLRAALVVAGAALAPAVALYGRAVRHGGREPELEQLPASAEAV
jgi:DHA3 family tetracycline resistance protein-like MFS transporter